MSSYESEPGVAPVRITTFKRQRKLWRRGYALETGHDDRYEDFFRDSSAFRRRD
ncbi:MULTISPECIES: hypothetical protein [unclassified Curtobacterium]|uniref:hypothetical protein n=1 Tax=unclassified Curtobacterium TaxID=257496 RepID=UPI0015E8D5AC|nr:MULTISPECIES: hypothetical protein [unclassified Curtobacterium]WIE55608.1 hypothetical protein DEI88_005260 [Curtobacterium sp. MCBD17_003]